MRELNSDMKSAVYFIPEWRRKELSEEAKSYANNPWLEKNFPVGAYFAEGIIFKLEKFFWFECYKKERMKISGWSSGKV